MQTPDELALLNGVTFDATRERSGMEGASTAASSGPAPGFDVESFIHEYYDAWGGTDLDRIMSYYSEDVVLQIPGLLMEGKDTVRDQFAVPFTTAFPGNRHIVKGMIFGPGVVNVEFIFEPQHKGPFAGHAATGAPVKLPGCGVYQYDSAKRQITAGRIYFDVGTSLIAIERQRSQEALRNALEQIQKSESRLRQVIDAMPTLAWCNLPDGPNEFLNKGWHEYTGLSKAEGKRVER